MKENRKWLLVLLVVLGLAGAVRFWDLGHAAVRSDEISFLFRTMQNQSLIELWKNPPWFNQIPLADSVPVIWARLTGQVENTDEASLRQPFALLGWLTVGFCCIWMLRRRGWGAGLLLGVWMAILPLHVYHSREAYYYVPVMLFAAGMSLRGADFMVILRRCGRLETRQYAEWTAWALLACLAHMSVWIVAAVTGLWLACAGWLGMDKPQRKRHAVGMVLVAAVMAAGMIRWVLRALYEMKRAAADPSAHIGSSFNWVGPRVLLFFMGGGNWIGGAILLIILVIGGWLFWKSRGHPGRIDALYSAVTALAWCGLASSYVYIFFVGGGSKAKLTYFLVNLPVFLVWAVMSLDLVFQRGGRGSRKWFPVAMAGVLVAMLSVPVWKVMNVDGKPTSYRQIRSWLDEKLAPGDAVLIDRWLEPWNEMAFYAPSNVTVTFTVPDEPYQNYVDYQWRKVTAQAIRENRAQAFIRIARNHEKQLGLWTWPETWFHHRMVITNAAGLWLRDAGFAPMEEFYSETNRLMTEIFYDTHEEIAERAREAGREAVWFFGPGWRLFKPWQQGDFTDYRILDGEGRMTIYNLQDRPVRMQGEVTAAAANGNPVVQIGGGPAMTFPSGQLSHSAFELDLQPGPNEVLWKQRNASGILLVRDLSLSAEN